jgi:hypothetical protein
VETEDYENNNRFVGRKGGEIECVAEKKCKVTTPDMSFMVLLTEV